MSESTSVSVIMSVYNTNPEWLSLAIRSILLQSYNSFEFIVINDASTNPDVESVLLKYADEDDRMIIIKNEYNIGLTKSLNKALEVSKGEFVARMDGDDISDKRRLERQVQYMIENEDVAVLGCEVDVIGDKIGSSIYPNYTNRDYELFLIKMMFKNVGPIHPTSIIRRKYLRDYNIKYDENIKKAQDYKLWMDILRTGGKIKILEERLVSYRHHKDQISMETGREQDDFIRRISKENFIKKGFLLEDDELNCIANLYNPGFHEKSAKKTIAVLKKAERQNREMLLFDKKKFLLEIRIRWLHKSIKSIMYGKDFSPLKHLFTYRCLFSKATLYWINDYILRK